MLAPRVKVGVNLQGVAWPLLAAAVLYDYGRRYAGYGQGTITSGIDGEHRDGSLHYLGYAIDLRTHDLPGGSTGHIAQDLASWMAQALSLWLPGPWRVLVESDHIHVELTPLR